MSVHKSDIWLYNKTCIEINFFEMLLNNESNVELVSFVPITLNPLVLYGPLLFLLYLLSKIPFRKRVLVFQFFSWTPLTCLLKSPFEDVTKSHWSQ